jgi:hypothetical protein
MIVITIISAVIIAVIPPIISMLYNYFSSSVWHIHFPWLFINYHRRRLSRVTSWGIRTRIRIRSTWVRIGGTGIRITSRIW